MQKHFSIAQKIWSSLSILILGYLFSITLCFYLGQQIEFRLLEASERIFPLAQKSEVALTQFKKIMRLYSDAVMIGDTDLIDEAQNETTELNQTFQDMAAFISKQDQTHYDILKTALHLKDFSYEAENVYRQLSKNVESDHIFNALTETTRLLANQAENIKVQLASYADRFSQELKHEIADVRQSSHDQRFFNLFVFIGVVICSSFLIALIISRSVVKPLRKTFLLEKVTEQFNDGIAVTDLDGKIYFTNLAWGKMHGYSQEALIGETMAKCHTPKQMYNEFIPLYNMALKEGLGVGEVGHQHKDGRVMPTFTTISQIFDEQANAFGHIHSVKDITMQKRHEKALVEAKKEADAANAAKSVFLANMSHEIRTPLNGVMGVLNLLLSTKLNQEQLDLIRTGKASADSLLTVISDILDFSKIEAGKLDLEILDFDLRNTVDESIKLPAMQAHSKGLEFAYTIHSDVPSLVQGDPVRLRQIILNLTSNAIKFTQQGEVILRVDLLRESDQDAVIKFEVTDTGIGIPEDKCNHVFSEFQQADTSTTRTHGGTGLGLSISKKLVEMMNGEIGLKSQLGKGSTFWFTAGFLKQPHSKKELIPLPDSVANKRFLLVDDNKTNLYILGGYLTAWGCSFDMAQSGDIALKLMHAVAKVNAPFDAVVVDMLMPVMDGAELGRQIKKDPVLRNTKLVMLTSMGLRGDATRMKEIGFSVYLTKPIRRSQLFNSLVYLFNGEPSIDRQKKQILITKHMLSDQEKQDVRILVAEDNVINQKLVMHMIAKLGFNADAVSDGKEALERLETFDYDIVLMDINMPHMDGIEATRQVRNPNTKVLNHAVPIIALTANAMKGDKEIFFQAGMDDYVPKPIDPQKLLNAIEKNVKSAKQTAHTSNIIHNNIV